jgi:hypothetical protein
MCLIGVAPNIEKLLQLLLRVPPEYLIESGYKPPN